LAHRIGRTVYAMLTQGRPFNEAQFLSKQLDIQPDVLSRKAKDTKSFLGPGESSYSHLIPRGRATQIAPDLGASMNLDVLMPFDETKIDSFEPSRTMQRRGIVSTTKRFQKVIIVY
jgi:hypothetical protein